MLPVLLVVVYVTLAPAKKLTYYADFEHPNITYWNPKYYEYVNLTAQRYSRKDPIHYISFHTKTLTELGNDVMVEGYLYEFLSNEYRRSMIEARFKFCDVALEKKYDIFKPFYKNFFNFATCPFPKGEYHFSNFSVPNLPLLATFPFHKGRLFCLFYYEETGERILELNIDGVIKQRFL